VSDAVMEKFLHTWREKFGETASSKKYGNVYTKIPVKGRKEALIIFFMQMKELGYEKERFSKQSFVAELIPFVFGEAPWVNKEQQKRAHGALATEVKDILLGDIWDDEKTKEETAKLFSGTPQPTTRLAKPTTQPDSKAAPAVPEKEAPEPEERYGKEVDRSLYAHLPKTQVVLDEEFAKLIGVDPDE